MEGEIDMKESRPDIHSPQTKPLKARSSDTEPYGEVGIDKDKTADEFSERIEEIESQEVNEWFNGFENFNNHLKLYGYEEDVIRRFIKKGMKEALETVENNSLELPCDDGKETCYCIRVKTLKKWKENLK